MSQLFMDSYADYADRAKLMTHVHAKRKSAAEQGSALKGGADAASKQDGAAEDTAALGSG
jgi:hypothetical protein